MEGMQSGETAEKSPNCCFTGSSAVELEGGTSIRCQHVNRKIRMQFLHWAMEGMLEPLKGCERRSFEVEQKQHAEWQCFPVITF